MHSPFVKTALQVRQAIALADCTEVCRLYASLQNMGQALLDTLMPKVRLTGLKVLLKSCGPTGLMPLKFLAERLGFSSLSQTRSEPETPSLPGCSTSRFQGHHYPKVPSPCPMSSFVVRLQWHTCILCQCPCSLLIAKADLP